jgi:hypothetical protein
VTRTTYQIGSRPLFHGHRPFLDQGVLVKRFITALAVAFIAFPATALAMPYEPVGSGSQPSSRAPHIAPRLPATGTDAAAPDQQSSAPSASPAPASAGSEFDWSDAGIGAAVATALLGVSLAGGVTARRRQDRRPSALAG